MKRFLLAAAVAAALFAPAASCADEKDRTLSVSARASGDFAPDTVTVTFAVETMAKGAKESASENARRMDEATRSVKKALGPDDRVATTSFSILPVYEFARDKGRVLSGFRTVNQATITSRRPGAAAELLDRAIEAGANRVTEVRFSLGDASAACDGLIRKASSEAAAMAGSAAESFGARLSGVKSLAPSCEGDFEMPVRPFAEEAALASAQTPVEPGAVRLRASVEAVYYLAE